MNILRIGLMSAALVAGLASADAQVVAADSVMQHVNGKRLSIGGYGEVAFSRNFYSDSGNRYSSASLHKNDPSHGRFDIPHAVIYLGYDFGKGWTFGTEIEFEHGGTGSAIEYEAEEAIEFEQEQEKGGEVELEQFWIQKSFGKFLNIRAGHMATSATKPSSSRDSMPISSVRSTGSSLAPRSLSSLRQPTSMAFLPVSTTTPSLVCASV